MPPSATASAGEVEGNAFLDRPPLSLSHAEPPPLAPGARFKLCGREARRVANGWFGNHWLGARPGGVYTLSPHFAFDTAATFAVNAAPADEPADAAAAARLPGFDRDATPLSLSVDLGDGEPIPFEHLIGHKPVTAVHAQKKIGDDEVHVKRWQVFLAVTVGNSPSTSGWVTTTTIHWTADGPLHVKLNHQADRWGVHWMTGQPPFEQNKTPSADEMFDIALLEPSPAGQRVKREDA